MLRAGQKPRPGGAPAAEESIKDPLVLEFLGLKDEYSESDLENGLIERLESFLLELGGEFAFISASDGCASATLGIGSICSSSIVGFAAWS